MAQSSVVDDAPEPTSAALAPLGQHVEVMPLISDDEISRCWRIAKALAASGMFKDATQAEQAFSKILLGRDLGLSPTQSMTGIHMIEGKPEVAAVTLGSFVRRSGYSYRVEWRLPDGRWQRAEPEGDATGCRIMFIIDGEEHGPSIWTLEDTQRAGLDKPTRSGKPSNHVRFPRSMYFARAMSQGVKRYAPECTGGVPVYFEGEIEQSEIPSSRHLGAGDGDGSAPEWQLTNPDRVREVEHVLERAAQAGQPIDRASVQMMLNGQPDGVVMEWIDRVLGELPVQADPPEPEEVTGTVVEPVTAQADVRRVTQMRYDADPDFRQKVDRLLSQQQDLELAIDEDGPNSRALIRDLDRVKGELDALGIPGDWFPASDGGGTERLL